MGTNFVNPISRGKPPFFHESSMLRSGRDSDSVQKAWKKNAAASNQTFRLSQSVEQVQRELNRLRLRGRGSIARSVSNPFKITPGLAVDPADNWLTFRVSMGWVIATGAPIIPTGIEDDPGPPPVPHEHSITAGVGLFYFVLTITSPTTAAVTTSSTLPAWGIDVIPIGWVDTDTYSAETPPRSVIYQFLRDHVFSPCVTE